MFDATLECWSNLSLPILISPTHHQKALPHSPLVSDHLHELKPIWLIWGPESWTMAVRHRWASSVWWFMSNWTESPSSSLISLTFMLPISKFAFMIAWFKMILNELKRMEKFTWSLGLEYSHEGRFHASLSTVQWFWSRDCLPDSTIMTLSRATSCKIEE